MSSLHRYKVGDWVHAKRFNSKFEMGRITELVNHRHITIKWAGGVFHHEDFHYHWLEPVHPLRLLAEAAE